MLYLTNNRPDAFLVQFLLVFLAPALIAASCYMAMVGKLKVVVARLKAHVPFRVELYYTSLLLSIRLSKGYGSLLAG